MFVKEKPDKKKLVILFSNSDLSVSYLTFKTNLLVSILFTLAANSSYSVFLITSLFTTSLSSLRSSEQALIYQYLIHPIQILNKLNLFLMQSLKYQHLKYF